MDWRLRLLMGVIGVFSFAIRFYNSYRDLDLESLAAVVRIQWEGVLNWASRPYFLWVVLGSLLAWTVRQQMDQETKEE